jgi:hypothetical protein
MEFGFQWAEVALGVLGFGITWTSGVIGLTRAVENIKSDTTKKIADNKDEHEEALAALRDEVLALQKDRDRNFGDIGAALREKIASVEREMHQIEIWGRDHYAVKDDITLIMNEIRTIRTENKADFTAISAKLDAKTADNKADFTAIAAKLDAKRPA